MDNYHKLFKVIIIIFITMFICCCISSSSSDKTRVIINAAKKTSDKKKKKIQIRTIESKLTKKTKKLIKKIKKCNKDTAIFRGYDAKTYRELTRYLNSEWHMRYEHGVVVTNVHLVKKRIKSVERVNKILYKKVKKLYKGKNMETLFAIEEFIEDKITYKLSNPDMYRDIRNGTCVSYSTMLKVMCDIAKIPCRIYVGWASPYDGHCWNRVKIKKKWYWIDLCWDDNTLCGDDSYLRSRILWEDHFDYKPLTIYRPSLPY